MGVVGKGSPTQPSIQSGNQTRWCGTRNQTRWCGGEVWVNEVEVGVAALMGLNRSTYREGGTWEEGGGGTYYRTM